MKITQLYIYPIKGLRAIPVPSARLGPQGFRHDRRFMIFRVLESGKLKNVQLSSTPSCALFSQTLFPSPSPSSSTSSSSSPHEPREGPREVIIRYNPPPSPLVPFSPLLSEELRVPLDPKPCELGEKLEVDLHGSPTTCYRMSPRHDEWLSACFGFECFLVYLGDGRRRLLGENMAPERPALPQKGWSSLPVISLLLWLWWTIASYMTGRGVKGSGASEPEEEPWITFTDVAPLLVTAEASLKDVQKRFGPGDEVPMLKFRPNLVIGSASGADGKAWAEDFWDTLHIHPSPSSPDSPSPSGRDDFRLLLTANCGRCTSLNADYTTGRVAEGDLGRLLKTLMKDRRVDTGNKYSPVFGRYAFLDGRGEVEVRVGDEISVGSRREERAVWDWKG